MFWMIDGSGGDGVSPSSLDKTWYGKYVVETEEEAGRRVNLHSSLQGGEIVWEGG